MHSPLFVCEVQSFFWRTSQSIAALDQKILISNVCSCAAKYLMIESDLPVSKMASVACDQMQAETRGSGDWWPATGLLRALVLLSASYHIMFYVLSLTISPFGSLPVSDSRPSSWWPGSSFKRFSAKATDHDKMNGIGCINVVGGKIDNKMHLIPRYRLSGNLPNLKWA